MNKKGHLIGILALSVTFIALQLLATGFKKEFYLTQLTMSLYYAVVVMGLCLLMGYTGQASLGHGAFFALGGYFSAVLTTFNFAALDHSDWAFWLARTGIMAMRKNIYNGTELLSVAPWAAFLVALFASALVAAIVGYPSLRLKGHYLAMATLGFGLIIYRILLGTEITGLADGITGVPALSLGFGVNICGKRALRVVNYYAACVFAVFVLVLLLNLVKSRVGRALRAIHNNETAANAMGINTASFKLIAFVVSAALAAAAGSLLTHFNEGIGPSEADALKSVRYLALVAAGGMANLWGALIVSVVLNFLSLRGYFGTYDHAVFGVILILIVSVTPEGPFRPLANGFRQLTTLVRKSSKTERHGIA